MSGSGPEPWEEARTIDEEHRYSLVRVRAPDGFALAPLIEETRDEEGYVLGGMIEWHRRPDDPARWCVGGVYWVPTEADRPVWELRSLEPLHIEPSIHCLACGRHGYIRGGTWQEA